MLSRSEFLDMHPLPSAGGKSQPHPTPNNSTAAQGKSHSLPGTLAPKPGRPSGFANVASQPGFQSHLREGEISGIQGAGLPRRRLTGFISTFFQTAAPTSHPTIQASSDGNQGSRARYRFSPTRSAPALNQWFMAAWAIHTENRPQSQLSFISWDCGSFQRML